MATMSKEIPLFRQQLTSTLNTLATASSEAIQAWKDIYSPTALRRHYLKRQEACLRQASYDSLAERNNKAYYTTTQKLLETQQRLKRLDEHPLAVSRLFLHEDGRLGRLPTRRILGKEVELLHEPKKTKLTKQIFKKVQSTIYTGIEKSILVVDNI